MAKNITTAQVQASNFKSVFAAYPELRYDLAFLTNGDRDLLVQFRVRPGFTFDRDKQGKVLSMWLGEKVGQYRTVSFGGAATLVVVIYTAERNTKYELIEDPTLIPEAVTE